MTKFPILASYAYLRETETDRVRQLVADPRIEFLLDSGAFTAFNVGKTIELQDYIAWVHAWKPHLFGYMALDVLQDPVATDANQQTMMTAGLVPIPVHHRSQP